jgi:hypothetical protein
MPVPAGTHGSPAGDGIGAPRRGRAQGRGAAADPEHETGLSGGGESRRTANRRRRAPDTCGGNGDGQRGFRPPRADSVEGEEEGGEAELQGRSAEPGEAWNGEGGWRPWRACSGVRGGEKQRWRESAREGEKVSERERGGRRGLIL